MRFFCLKMVKSVKKNSLILYPRALDKIKPFPGGNGQFTFSDTYIEDRELEYEYEPGISLSALHFRHQMIFEIQSVVCSL